MQLLTSKPVCRVFEAFSKSATPSNPLFDASSGQHADAVGRGRFDGFVRKSKSSGPRRRRAAEGRGAEIEISPSWRCRSAPNRAVDSQADRARGRSKIEGMIDLLRSASFDLRPIRRQHRPAARPRANHSRRFGGRSAPHFGLGRSPRSGLFGSFPLGRCGRGCREASGHEGWRRQVSKSPNGRNGTPNASVHTGGLFRAVQAVADRLLTSVSFAAPLC